MGVKAGTLDTPVPDLGMLLAQASHALALQLTARLEQIGSSPRVHCVLSAAAADDHTQIQLAEICGLDKTTMVTTVDELERAGLAERRPSATDRRARIIAVTPAGRKLLAKSSAIVHDTYDEVLSSLPAGQRQAFLDSLCQIVSGCLAQPAQCQKPPRRPRGS